MGAWLCYAFNRLYSDFSLHSTIPHITAFIIDITF